jgi:hypothetical protein
MTTSSHSPIKTEARRIDGVRFHSIDPGQLVARVYGSTGLVTGESRTVTSRNGVESRAHFRFIAVLFARGRFDPACSFSKYQSR